MKPPLDKSSYPVFFKNRAQLLSFTGPSEMSKIEMVGTNKGCEGFSIDFYKTRRMVLKYYGDGDKISKSDFEKFCKELFNAILIRIT